LFTTTAILARSRIRDACQNYTQFHYELQVLRLWQRLVASGVLTTPAMLINGQTVVMGRVPSPDEIKQLIADAV
jgi:hypothetical protein